MNKHICPSYVPITPLLFPTYSCQMAAILVLFFFCLPVHIDIHRNFIFGMNMEIYLLYMVITFLVIMTTVFLNDSNFGIFH